MVFQMKFSVFSAFVQAYFFARKLKLILFILLHFATLMSVHRWEFFLHVACMMILYRMLIVFAAFSNAQFFWMAKGVLPVALPSSYAHFRAVRKLAWPPSSTLSVSPPTLRAPAHPPDRSSIRHPALAPMFPCPHRLAPLGASLPARPPPPAPHPRQDGPRGKKLNEQRSGYWTENAK